MVPAYLVVIFLIWADVAWVLYIKHRLDFDARPLIVTLGLEALIYVSFTIFDTTVINTDVRRDIVRMSLIVISTAMAFPLTLLYFWKMKEKGKNNNGS